MDFFDLIRPVKPMGINDPVDTLLVSIGAITTVAAVALKLFGVVGTTTAWVTGGLGASLALGGMTGSPLLLVPPILAALGASYTLKHSYFFVAVKI